MAVPARRTESRSPLAAPSARSGRWGPARELEELHERMDQLMEGLWSGMAPNGDRIWTPLVDIEETEEAWIIEAEVPGAKRKDINVEVQDSELIIAGEIKERERKGLLRRRTRRTGRFDFRVTLPGERTRMASRRPSMTAFSQSRCPSPSRRVHAASRSRAEPG